jgi:glutamate-5-semialdehyde dehydrogenase
VSLATDIINGLARARTASRTLALASAAQKNAALTALASDLRAAIAAILAANEKDLATAKAAGQSGAFL